eukprot:jgi/Psemu1/24828/gm1.24828_g
MALALLTAPSSTVGRPQQVFWDNKWPSDLEPTNQNDALLKGTVLFAQAQTIPSKHGIENDDQPHLTALRKTLVMLKPHGIDDPSVGMEFTVRDKYGAIVSGDKPVPMNDPKNMPKHDGWLDLGALEYVPEFPSALENPYEVTGQNNLDMVGNDHTGAGLKEILNDNSKTPMNEVEVKTFDGSWVGDIYLPDGDVVPANSKVQITCESSWSVNVHYPNVQTGGHTSRKVSQGEVLIVLLTPYNRNVWVAPGDQSPEYVPEFPSSLENPYEVTGQNNLDMVGNDQTGAGLKEILNDNSKTPTNEVEVKTFDGSWAKEIYLPDGSGVPTGSKIQITCNSGYDVRIYYPDHNDYVFGHNFYSATMNPEWVKPGMTLEFASSNGFKGSLEAKVGGVTELIITTLDAGFLTEPRDEFTFRDDPTTNREYFETTLATRLTV